MNQETVETQEKTFAAEHPWLVLKEDPDQDSVEEVIRYTLDEIRYA